MTIPMVTASNGKRSAPTGPWSGRNTQQSSRNLMRMGNRSSTRHELVLVGIISIRRFQVLDQLLVADGRGFGDAQPFADLLDERGLLLLRDEVAEAEGVEIAAEPLVRHARRARDQAIDLLAGPLLGLIERPTSWPPSWIARTKSSNGSPCSEKIMSTASRRVSTRRAPRT